MLVVPNEEGIDFPTEVRLALRNQDPPSAFVFQGPNEAFDHGDASVFPNRAVSWTHSLSSTPAFEILVPEDAVPVTDQILGLGVCLDDHLAKERANGTRGGAFRENGKTHTTSRVMINDHGQPPTKRPALRKREGEAWSPESSTHGYDG